MSGWLGLAGSVAGGVLGYLGQKDANETNMALGREQMQFQERMSSTAYQRAIGDMRAAGLNPMLAYSQGGASSPVGSMPQVQNAVGAGVSSAAQSMSVLQGLTQVELGSAQADKIRTETERMKQENLSLFPEDYRSRWDYEQSIRKNRAELTAAQRASEERRWRMLGSQESTAESIAKREAGSWAADVEKRVAESELFKFRVPQAKAEAEWWDKIGQTQPAVRAVLELLRGILGRR